MKKAPQSLSAGRWQNAYRDESQRFKFPFFEGPARAAAARGSRINGWVLRGWFPLQTWLKAGGEVGPEIFVWNQWLVGSGREYTRIVADQEDRAFFRRVAPDSVDHRFGDDLCAFVGVIGDKVFWGRDQKTFLPQDAKTQGKTGSPEGRVLLG
jgi:hypothetical protein